MSIHDMISRAAAIALIETCGDPAVTEAIGQRLCCSGQMCGCRGSTVEELLLHDLRALPAAQVAVKPLDWVEVSDQIPKHAWAADVGFGRWLIMMEFLSMNNAAYRIHGVDYSTIEAAKAAAQADYEARIRSALIITTAPDPAQIMAYDGPETIANLAHHLRRMADGQIDAIDSDRLMHAAALIDTPPAPVQDVSSFASSAVTTPSEPGRMAEGDPPATIEPSERRKQLKEASGLNEELFRIKRALAYGCEAAINDLYDDAVLPQWTEDSGIGVMLKAIGCEETCDCIEVRTALKAASERQSIQTEPKAE